MTNMQGVNIFVWDIIGGSILMVKANGKMFIEFIEFALDETISLLSPPRFVLKRTR